MDGVTTCTTCGHEHAGTCAECATCMESAAKDVMNAEKDAMGGM